MPRKRKTQITVTVDSGLVEWLDQQVENFEFQSRSHAIEQAVLKFKKEKEAKQ